MEFVSSSHPPVRRNLKAEHAMEKHLAAINRAHINSDYAYQSERLIAAKINWLVSNCECVLDVGQSSREQAQFFLPGQLESVDINDNRDSPPD